MRRKDREIAEQARIEEVIEACRCCRLGLCRDGLAYIVPMNFAYIKEERVFYFHSAPEGRKLELIRENSMAAFELDTGHEVMEGQDACGYGFRYRSVMGKGKIELIEEKEEKTRALSLLMEHYTGRRDWEFRPEVLKRTAVIKLTVLEMTGKERK